MGIEVCTNSSSISSKYIWTTTLKLNIQEFYRLHIPMIWLKISRILWTYLLKPHLCGQRGRGRAHVIYSANYCACAGSQA